MRTKTTKIVGLLLTMLVLVTALGAFAITASAADTTVTLSFANKAQRITYSTSKQVWEQNGIVFTNDKGSSTSNVGDYASPARIYASSKITVEVPGKLITKIVFVCNSSSYATAMKNSIGAAATASGSNVTVTFATPVESFVVAKMTAQVRLNSMNVSYTEPATGGCAHENTKTVDNGDGKTHSIVCTAADCGETIRTADHTTKIVDCGDGNHKTECTVCQAVVSTEAHKNLRCSDNGDGTHKIVCTDCDGVVAASEAHDSDKICTKCGYVAPGIAYELTIAFDNVSKRTEYSTEKQVWMENGVTVTNNRATGNAIGDYSNPARFYKDSQLIVSRVGMTKIVFNCNSADYAAALKSSITTGTVSVDGKTVTVVLGAPQDNFTLTMGAQVRVDSITVYGGEEEEEAPLAFEGWSLTLQDNIALNLALKAELITSGLYTAPSVTFVIGERTIVVTEYNTDKIEGYYVFTLSDIAPHQMGETVIATLTATKDGETVTVTAERTIKEYCMQVLADETKGASLKTLVVDLLNYGAASQAYVGATTTPVNADLTEEQKAFATATVTLSTVANAAYQKVENAAATWAGAYLYLVDTVEMNFVFNAASIEGLTVKITTADPLNAEASGKTYTITEFTAYGEGAYVASFRGFGAAQMSETVYVTVCDAEGNAISNTYRYSIESYAFAKEQGIDANLATLVVAMMKYGNAAKNYNG